MSADDFQFITPLTDDRYRDLVRGLNRTAWPEFMLHDAVANEHWHHLLDSFAEYQLALYDPENDRVAAMANSIPLRWDDALENLPEGGWDWAFEQAVRQHKEGIAPNHHCAIQVVIHPDYQSRRLSLPMVKKVRTVTKAKGLEALIIPVRPSEKSKYPLVSLDDYISWKNDKGMPFDAWLRVHAKMGGRMVSVCHKSKKVRGTRAEWETWTGLKFPQSGRYIVPGALSPVEMDIGKDEGIYIEPNVWLVHSPA